MNRKIIVISDFDSTGSGYRNICVSLLKGLVELGYEVKVSGLMYDGQEHNLPFSIIPATTIQEAFMIVNNLRHVWSPDVILVAMDIPLQQYFFENLQPILKRLPQEIEQGITKPVQYIAITPLENGPLTLSWAAILLNMDALFFISELGKQEAIKAGISKAEHLWVGVDTALWHPATPEEKKQLRKGLGIADDEFVVLTVADNQERKNLWAGMEAVSMLNQELPTKVRYIMVTRVDSPVGWKLNDLAIHLHITKEFMTFKRGLPEKDLWGLYAVSDVYLSCSKADGLGMPVLEAMACGIPVVASDTGAHTELLYDDRGILVDGYKFGERNQIIDVWGNSGRLFIDIEKAKNYLWQVANVQGYVESRIKKALEYVRQRTWNIPVQQVHEKITELLG